MLKTERDERIRDILDEANLILLNGCINKERYYLGKSGLTYDEFTEYMEIADSLLDILEEVRFEIDDGSENFKVREATEDLIDDLEELKDDLENDCDGAAEYENILDFISDKVKAFRNFQPNLRYQFPRLSVPGDLNSMLAISLMYPEENKKLYHAYKEAEYLLITK